MVTITAGARVEGIDRTVYDAAGSHLKLPPVEATHARRHRLVLRLPRQRLLGCRHQQRPQPAARHLDRRPGLLRLPRRLPDRRWSDGTGQDRRNTRHVLPPRARRSPTTTATRAFAAGSLPDTRRPTSTACRCHVDHDKFNARQGRQPAPDITTRPGDRDRDRLLDSASNTGVCTTCHATSLAKQDRHRPEERRLDRHAEDRRRRRAPTSSARSAHNYYATSTFDDATTFNANCSKCHNDEQPRPTRPPPTTFGTHWSAARRILSAFGAAVTDPLGESAATAATPATPAGQRLLRRRAR